MLIYSTLYGHINFKYSWFSLLCLVNFTNKGFVNECILSGLPIQVRDTGLAVKDDMPKSDVNKEYYTQNMEREV